MSDVENSIPPIASGKIPGFVIIYFLGTFAYGKKHLVCLMPIKYLYCNVL